MYVHSSVLGEGRGRLVLSYAGAGSAPRNVMLPAGT